MEKCSNSIFVIYYMTTTLVTLILNSRLIYVAQKSYIFWKAYHGRYSMFTLSLLFLCNMALEKIALSKLFLQSVQLFLSRAVDIAFYGTSKINLLSSALCLRLHIPSKLRYILDLLIQRFYGERKYSKNTSKVDISDEL